MAGNVPVLQAHEKSKAGDLAGFRPPPAADPVRHSLPSGAALARGARPRKSPGKPPDSPGGRLRCSCRFGGDWGYCLSTTDTDERAWFKTEQRQNDLRLTFGGEWVVAEAERLDEQLRRLDFGAAREIDMDGSGIARLDSAGAWLLLRTKRSLEKTGKRVRSFKIPSDYDPLFDTLERGHVAPPVKIPERHTFRAFLERTGRGFVHLVQQGYAMVNFLGRVTVETVEALLRPDREIPWPAFVTQIEETGINALPIVGLLSFLIGVVIAYQGVDQLQRFGAEIFTINLVGVSVLREIGGLMTAIIVAGRSGSAFTAQIGTMKLNQEIDAMQTMGLNTAEALVLPRVLGLVITLPLLTFYADIMGLMGGALMSYFDLGFTVPVFIRQLESAITLNTFLVGMIKAPVYAFLIALVGCFEGLQVEGNAASVGKLTTRSVVEGIFLVIVFDAGFSILFSIVGI